jgi:hypothetical protein
VFPPGAGPASPLQKKPYRTLAKRGLIFPTLLNADPLSGDLFLFANRRRTRAKVLLWDGTGLCIYQKRIERGRFASLWRGDDEETVEMTLSELALFFEGSTLVGDFRLSPLPTVPRVIPSFLHETQPC